MTDLPPAVDAAPFDAPAFAARFLPLFERPGGPSQEELADFVDACYGDGAIVVFDWIEWRDQGHVLLETSGAMERATMAELQRLLTLLVRQEKFAEGTLAHAVEQGWLHHILARMSAGGGG
ncbi:MAG: hypothetical protein JWO69_285 [Thermoleophilia bacterium]|nr:hypothetical protein [Thermoleophilia bacterium]